MRNITWFGGLVVALLLAYYLGGRLQPGQYRYVYFDPQRLPPGTIHFMSLPLSKGSGVYLVNDNGTFYGVIATDPYDRCRVSWVRSEQAFVSPCTGSRYRVDGTYIDGPAAGDLDRYHTFIHRGNLIVDTERRIKGAPKPAETGQGD